jgi:hypothetical protein
MKKMFLSLIMVFAFMFAINQETNAQTPISLGINTGYSWLSGVIGGEFQVGHFILGAGYWPAKMPGSGETVGSIGWFLEYSDALWDESGYYVNFGMASNGYRSQYSYNNGPYGSDYTNSMMIVNVGYKYGSWNGWNMKAGCGYGWCEEAGVFNFELTLGKKFKIN